MYKLNNELGEIVKRHQESLDDGIDEEIALCRAQLERVLKDEKDTSKCLAKTEKMLAALMKAKQLSRKFKLESGKLVTIEAVAFLLRHAGEIMGQVVREHTDQETYYKCVDQFLVAWVKEFDSNPLLLALSEQYKN